MNTEALNEKYKTECIILSNCEKTLDILENKLRKQKTGLTDNYNKICIDCAKIFKWLYKFCFFHTSYLIQSSSLTKILIDFILEKISLQEELKNLNEPNIQSYIFHLKLLYLLIYLYFHLSQIAILY